MSATMATMTVVAVACPAPVVKSYFRGQRLNAGQLGVSVAARRSVLVVRPRDAQLLGAGKGGWENLDTAAGGSWVVGAATRDTGDSTDTEVPERPLEPPGEPKPESIFDLVIGQAEPALPLKPLKALESDLELPLPAPEAPDASADV